jgi:hypothetical protein
MFFGKESEKASEGKPVKELSGEKPSEQPQPKPKPKLVRFHCGYCGRDGHKDEFCFKKKREERMAKEWANKDRYNLSYGPPWAHYIGGYQDRLLGGPLGLPSLRYAAPEGVEHKDYTGVVLG